jgi:hypothetical protein
MHMSCCAALHLRDADACELCCVLTPLLLARSPPQCPMCRTPVEGAYVEWGRAEARSRAV